MKDPRPGIDLLVYAKNKITKLFIRKWLKPDESFMKFILGTKIGMTRVFDEEGRSFGVTKINACSCEVVDIKTKEKDGYNAIKISAFKIKNKVKKIIKTVEFTESNTKNFKKGDQVTLNNFNKNENVTIEGISKGKGFSGTIKRHGFSRGPVSHGSKNVRKPGSIGGGYPERVVKGKKMAGKMGRSNVTIKNLRVVDVDDQFILIAGSVPGANNSIVKIYGKGEKAEEIVDFAAEEERIAQEKMLEAEKEAKETENVEKKDENKTEDKSLETIKEEIKESSE